MPYIVQSRREALFKSGHDMDGSGELNYVLTRMLLKYVEQHGLSYKTINDILGALEGAKLEFYRRIVAPYEDIKIKENGDVFQ